MTTDSNPFSAADSALGYLFQCRYALLESLRRYRNADDYLVAIETLDDVVFEAKGQPLEILQTKHHLKRPGILSDGSPDLWKTLRVWCEGTASGHMPLGTFFYLVTTSSVSAGSAASLLGVEGRDPEDAYKKLSATANTSNNKDNKLAYAVFLKSPQVARSVLESMTILDSTLVITDLPRLIRKELRPAVATKFLDSFIERLEGWWFLRVIQQLARVIQGPIQSEELEDKIDRLREEFLEDNLPIDDDIRNADIDESINASLFLDEKFVHQLRLIRVTNPRIFIAIRQYFRAFAQRSKWMREDLLHVGELGRYENRLIEEWQMLFARMREDLGDAAAEEKKVEAARALYGWVEAQANFPIRTRCEEPFVTRGSFHMLANEMRVGWHPDFLELLKKTLDEAEVGA